MKVKKLLMNKLNSTALMLGLSLLSLHNTNAQTNITVDAGAEWVGSMNCYDLANNYLWSDGWGFNDLKATANTANNTVTLQPNFTWIIDEEQYWVMDGQSNKLMQAFPHVVANELIGENITYSGNVTSYTLAPGYTVKAYINMATLLDVEPYYIPRGEVTMPITSTGNFTLTWNTANIDGVEDANHLEYGFVVMGPNANPANEAALGSVVITDDEPQVIEPGGTVVTLDATNQANIFAYANWFNLDETYVNGSTWGIDDLKTEVNATNNTLILYPNYSTYGDPDFTNGDMGSKIFEGNTYIEDNSLIGSEVTFEGYCISNSLASGYDGIAFIKVLSGDYQLLNYSNVPLVGGQEFSITVNIADYPAAAHVQYGYSVTGINANPNQMEALGNAVVTSSAPLGTNTFTANAVSVYPNPATNELNIVAASTIETVNVFNVMGQKVLTAAANQNSATINVSGLKAGMYIVTTTTINGKQNAVRFIKQ